MSPLAAFPRLVHVIVADCPEVRIKPFWRGISIIAMVKPPHCVAKTVLLATFMTGALGILGACGMAIACCPCGTIGGAGIPGCLYPAGSRRAGYQACLPPKPGSSCSFSSGSSFSSFCSGRSSGRRGKRRGEGEGEGEGEPRSGETRTCSSGVGARSGLGARPILKGADCDAGSIAALGTGSGVAGLPFSG